MTKQVKHNKETYDYILGAYDGCVTITKYLNEQVWNEKYQTYFTKTQEIIKTDNARYLASAIEMIETQGIIGTIYMSSSMDFAHEYGFAVQEAARDLWNEAWQLNQNKEYA